MGLTHFDPFLMAFSVYFSCVNLVFTEISVSYGATVKFGQRIRKTIICPSVMGVCENIVPVYLHRTYFVANEKTVFSLGKGLTSDTCMNEI